ncbi:MAG TPA: nuclear transport factor 2 family protein [Chloroflexota bacterium]
MSSFSEEQALVAEANAAFYRAFEALDVERMQAVWLHSDEVKCIHPGWEVLTGWEAVIESWEAIIRNTLRIRFELGDVSVVVNGGIGWVECLEHIYDGETLAGLAIATNLFQQNPDGRWLMIHHHASPFARRMGRGD